MLAPSDFSIVFLAFILLAAFIAAALVGVELRDFRDTSTLVACFFAIASLFGLWDQLKDSCNGFVHELAFLLLL